MAARSLSGLGFVWRSLLRGHQVAMHSLNGGFERVQVSQALRNALLQFREELTGGLGTAFVHQELRATLYRHFSLLCASNGVEFLV